MSRRRAETKQSVTVEESDRLRRVKTFAEETFADKDKTNRWLRRPLTELGGETPLAIAQTEAGTHLLKTILAKIAWGAAA